MVDVEWGNGVVEEPFDDVFAFGLQKLAGCPTPQTLLHGGVYKGLFCVVRKLCAGISFGTDLYLVNYVNKKFSTPRLFKYL